MCPLVNGLDIIIQDNNWLNHNIDYSKIFNEIFLKLTKTLNIENIIETIDIPVLMTNDNEITQLNLNYRNKNQPTNVLSFNYFSSLDEIKQNLTTDEETICIGEIAISYETIIKETKEQNKSLENHLLHIFLHGILHILGYDHIKPEEAETMEKLEIEILSYFNIPNPYETLT